MRRQHNREKILGVFTGSSAILGGVQEGASLSRTALSKRYGRLKGRSNAVGQSANQDGSIPQQLGGGLGKGAKAKGLEEDAKDAQQCTE